MSDKKVVTSVTLDAEIGRALDKEIASFERFNISRSWLINDKLKRDKDLQKFIRADKL